jgi:hypothetical protein
MRRIVQLALTGSLMVAAASPLAIAGEGQSAAPTEPAQLAGYKTNIVPLPVYEPEKQSGPPVQVWSI